LGVSIVLAVTDIQRSFPELSGITYRAEGGQKLVFDAMRSGQPAILKVFKDAGASPDRVERELEATARVASFNSKWVPVTYDHGVRAINGGDRLYIVEECLDAEPLRAFMNAGGITVSQTLDIVEAIVESIMDFERAQLVHRDIKPENILIDDAGRIWLIDFGLVRVLDLPSLSATHGPGAGYTPGYAARELLRYRKREIDSNTDLFSAGVVAHELLHGKHHFWGSSANVLQVCQRMMAEDFPRLNILGDDGRLSDFVAKMTSRYKSRRPQDASAARTELAEIRMELSL
jgi:eukaryotic-like serine/threonine-protein kinase